MKATTSGPGGRRATIRPPFEIGGVTVAAGSRQTIELPVSVLANHIPVSLPVHVVHGRKHGPVVFLSAAVHGDEIVGVDIIRRVLQSASLNKLAGTLVAVPIVNVFGFLNQSRYLPDRRDLNRSFPGSGRGSLAAQLADLFLNEVVRKSQFGIDLHSAPQHRMNLPQIRISPNGSKLMRELAMSFGAPITLVSAVREGSLRAAARSVGVETLVYEGGEALRFDELPVRIGVRGTLSVLHHLHMLPGRPPSEPRAPPLEASETRWVRAPRGGLLRTFKTIGEAVEKGERIGIIADPFGDSEIDVLASARGLIIGRTNLPLVNSGDALLNIASIQDPGCADEHVVDVHDSLEADTCFEYDEGT